MNTRTLWVIAGLSLALGLIAACGVKGPPLPPIASTPQDSERAVPSPVPRISPTPVGNSGP